MRILLPLVFFSGFFLVCMVDLYSKTLRRPLPHRDQPHVRQAGDVEAEEDARARYGEWIDDWMQGPPEARAKPLNDWIEQAFAKALGK